MHPKSVPRRYHSDELKVQVLAACDEPGASVFGIALAHGLSANPVRKRRSGRGAKRAGTAITSAAASQAAPLGSTAEFVAIGMPAPRKAATRAAGESMAAVPIAGPQMQIELRRGPLQLNVRWPPAAAEDCRAWLSELCSGLLK